MKYFTKELWRRLQTPNWRRANAEWHRRFRNYSARLRKLTHLLSPGAKRFFRKPLLLHDGTLVSFSVGDFQHLHLARFRRGTFKAHDLTVHIGVVDDGAKPKLHKLVYTGISKVKVDFPSDDPLFLSPRKDLFYDWGYDELTIAGKDLLRHEILFASGATILIEFRSLKYRAERIPKR